MGKKIFAGLIVLLVIVTAIPALLLYNVQSTVFSASSYKNILAEQDFYQQLPALLAAQISPAAGTAGKSDSRSSPLESLSADELSGGLNVLVTKAGFQSIFEDAIDRAFAFLDGKASSISIPLTTIKTSIDKNGVAAVHHMLDAKPACSKSEIKKFEKGWLPDCRVPDAMFARLDTQIAAELQKVKAELPNQFELVTPADGAKQKPQLETVNKIRTGMALSPLLPLLLLGIIALLFYKTKPTLMRWIGVPLVIVGVLGMAISKFSGLVALEIIQKQIGSAGLAASTRDLAMKIGEAASQSLVSPIFVQAIVLTLIGIGLIIGAFFVAKSAVPAMQDQSATAE